MIRHILFILVTTQGAQFESELQEQLNEAVADCLHSSTDSTHVLIDVPVERGLLKVGDDLNVLTHNHTVVPLERLSGIASGVRRGFQEQLQRFRVFLNPETFERLTEEERKHVRATVKSELETLV